MNINIKKIILEADAHETQTDYITILIFQDRQTHTLHSIPLCQEPRFMLYGWSSIQNNTWCHCVC